MKRLQFPFSSPVGRTSLALLFIGVTMAGCRKEQMGDGSYQKPFKPTDFFADHNSARPLVEGTIARSGADSDTYGYERTAMSVTAMDAAAAPVTATSDFPADFPKDGEPLKRALERGQERFNIYCAVCHGRTGAADGMIVQRGFIRPPAFYPLAGDAKGNPDLYRRELNLLSVPPGYFFDKITNGYGAMFSYAARVQPEDRWKIAAYIRVLQVSQMSRLSDLDPADQAKVTSSTVLVKPTEEAGGLGGAPGAKPVITTLPIKVIKTAPEGPH
jgi:mono/diheme cytochrome c family protein